MGCPSGARDNDLETGGLGAFGEAVEPLGRAVGGDEQPLGGNTEGVERLGGMPHGLPVGLASHDDGNWGGHGGLILKKRRKDKDYRSGAPPGNRFGAKFGSWSMPGRGAGPRFWPPRPAGRR